jgi:predicted N-acetyltransferase YhbS
LAAKKLPRQPVPVILLARLAVDRSVQGQRLREKLLVGAMKRSVELSRSIGAHAIEVDAIEPEARSFYERYGFVTLPGEELHLYLPIQTIQDAFV